MDQHKAETPTRILALIFLFILFNQLPNILVIFVGGVMLYVKYIMRQIIFVKGHEKKDVL